MADADNDDDRLRPSPDDALESPDDIYNPDVDQEHLEEDYEPPAAPANPRIAGPKLPPDHPAFDTDLQFEEYYDEGSTSATDIDALEEEADPDEPYPLEPEENEGREQP